LSRLCTGVGVEPCRRAVSESAMKLATLRAVAAREVLLRAVSAPAMIEFIKLRMK
jgi:hypothetical protein